MEEEAMDNFKAKFSLNYGNANLAGAAKRTLCVDNPLHPNEAKLECTAENGRLTFEIKASSMRLLSIKVKAALETVELMNDVINEYGIWNNE